MYSKWKENKKILKEKKLNRVKLKDKISVKGYFNGPHRDLYGWSNSNCRKHERSSGVANNFDYREHEAKFERRYDRFKNKAKQYNSSSIFNVDAYRKERCGNHMKLDDITLTLICQVMYCAKSPTSELLNKYSERNGTVEQLFIWLYRMDHQRAMCVLAPYVDEKYHRLLKNESAYSTSFNSYSKKDDISRPSSSRSSTKSTKSLSELSQVPSTYKNISEASGFSSKQAFPSKMSKLDYNLNINQTRSSISISMPQMKSKDMSKKSFDLQQLQKQKSYSDNCLTEKIKIIKTFSAEEKVLCGKQMKHSHVPPGLSSDLNNPIGDLGMNLSPMEIELNYGFKKEVQNNLSQEKKMLNTSSTDNAANSAMPFVVDQMKNISLTSKKTEISLKREDCSIPSVSSSLSEKELNISRGQTKKSASSYEESFAIETRVSSLPWISILKLQESKGKSKDTDSKTDSGQW